MTRLPNTGSLEERKGGRTTTARRTQMAPEHRVQDSVLRLQPGDGPRVLEVIAMNETTSASTGAPEPPSSPEEFLRLDNERSSERMPKELAAQVEGRTLTIATREKFDLRAAEPVHDDSERWELQTPRGNRTGHARTHLWPALARGGRQGDRERVRRRSRAGAIAPALGGLRTARQGDGPEVDCASSGQRRTHRAALRGLRGRGPRRSTIPAAIRGPASARCSSGTTGARHTRHGRGRAS